MEDKKLENKIKLPHMNPGKVSREIEDFIIQETLRFNCTGCVIGLSGGVDSSTVAGLAKRAFNRHNKYGPKDNGKSENDELELVGYILPSDVNSPDNTNGGIKLAEKLSLRYKTIGIEPFVRPFEEQMAGAVEDKTRKGNLMSRIRANILHTAAAEEKKLVIGTGNKDEDYVLGYYTHFGDGAVHISPIGNLSKRLVREMCGYIGLEEYAGVTPTAELEARQTDFRDLGYHYRTAELISEGYDQGLNPKELYSNKQVIESIGLDIAEYKEKFGRSRFNSAKETVYDVLHKRAIAELKAQLVNPKRADVSLYYR